jgi:hypothetical protein
MPSLVAVLSVVAVSVSGCGAATSTPSTSASSTTTGATASPATPPTSATTVTTSPTTSVTATGILGPKGYGSLKLGMSYADAIATGQLEKSKASVFGWTVKGHPDAPVCLKKTGGLMAIFGDSSMATPEGIGLGSTLKQVKGAYPNLKQKLDYFYAPTSATTRYIFLIQADNKKVHEWNLSTTDQTCFN